MIFDALYGEITMPGPFDELLWCPEIQRLRHVFLSNVPSFDMPGIAQVSRYEHSIGTWALAHAHAKEHGLNEHDATVVQVAALLHDAAMPGLGHLMEEAFCLAGVAFDHESHLEALFKGRADSGGTAFQVFAGKEVAFRRVLDKHRFPASIVTEILGCIRGHGRLAPLISGSIDLDNLDNVCRIAYHMGLAFESELPMRLAKGLRCVDGALQTTNEGIHHVEAWQSLRERVYERLMFAPLDFAAKTMLVRMLSQVAKPGHADGLVEDDWRLTYEEATTKLRQCDADADKVFEHLYAGELFRTVALVWMGGRFPGLRDVVAHEAAIRRELEEECWIYAIKDKRKRRVDLTLADRHKSVTVGADPEGWLCGLCTSTRARSARLSGERICEVLADAFSCAAKVMYPYEDASPRLAIGNTPRLFD